MGWPSWFNHLCRMLRREDPPIAPALWQATLASYRFLAALDAPAQARLLELTRAFLGRKQFHGAHGLEVTDAMAVAIAAQACMPLVRWARAAGAARVLRWYDGFVGIVVHADEVLAAREVVDESGVVHRYRERLAGEAMEDGPVMLNWHDVAQADTWATEGCNLVIHEFAHKIDMRTGIADGCPPLPPGFGGTASASAARAHWQQVLCSTYDGFREQVILAERFGAPPTWLDPYAAESHAEFFAVACEAFFVQPERFAQEFSAFNALLTEFFSASAAS